MDSVRAWIPAFAGMTSKGDRNIKMDSSFRWNDGEVVCRSGHAQTLRAWIPAFAGMTNESDRNINRPSPG